MGDIQWENELGDSDSSSSFGGTVSQQPNCSVFIRLPENMRVIQDHWSSTLFGDKDTFADIDVWAWATKKTGRCPTECFEDQE